MTTNSGLENFKNALSTFNPRFEENQKVLEAQMPDFEQSQVFLIHLGVYFVSLGYTQNEISANNLSQLLHGYF